MKCFVTGIGTDVGKTVVSAVLCKALGLSYWKPIQCGTEDGTDSLRLKSLVPGITVYKEEYCLKMPASPHIAAEEEGVEINLMQFNLPVSENILVEGAGGLLVPVNEKGDTILNLIEHLDLGVILVIRNYLGSINHTMLTFDVLRHNNIKVIGYIISGDEVASSEEIYKQSGYSFLGRIRDVDEINKNTINQLAEELKNQEEFIYASIN